MHHLFINPSQLSADQKTLRITGDDYHHMVRVLRMKAGEELSASLQESGEEYRFGITEITEHEVICSLRFVKRDTAELPVRLILLQGLPKGDKMEQIIEKNTELGVAEIVPVSLKRCVMKLDEKKAAARVARWNKIAEAAAKQARRGIIPRVTGVMSLGEALAHVKDADVKLVPYELEPVEGEGDSSDCGMSRTRRLIESAGDGQSAAVLIGPEGGFEESEILQAKEAGFSSVTLGSRILRTETAGMTVSAWFAYRF